MRNSIASVRNSRLHSRRWLISRRKAVRPGTISVPRPDVILLQAFTCELHFNRAPSPIGIWFRIVAERVEMRQIVSDGGKRFLFIPPTLGKIGLAASGRAHTFKNGGRNGLKPRLGSAYHVDRYAC